MRHVAQVSVVTIVAAMIAACGSRSESLRKSADSSHAQLSRAVSPNSEPTSALVAFLEASRAGATTSAVPFDSLVTCQIGGGMYQPIELLATYRVLSAVGVGDTLTVSARVTTVAEEDGSPTHSNRFVAVQRIKTDTQQWR